jgi:hypothetical protein
VLGWVVIRPRGWPEAVAAVPAAALVIGTGALSARAALAEAERLGPVIGFLLARDGDRSRLGPKSLGPADRFVVDHAPVPGPARLAGRSTRHRHHPADAAPPAQSPSPPPSPPVAHRRCACGPGARAA